MARKKKIILILICHKEIGTHELIYKKRNYYILKRQFCYKRKRSQEKGLLKQGLVCVDKQELVCVNEQGLVCEQTRSGDWKQEMEYTKRNVIIR